MDKIELAFLCFTIFFFVVGLVIGDHSANIYMKRKLLYHIWDYREKTVKEMFTFLLDLTDKDWLLIEEKNK